MLRLLATRGPGETLEVALYRVAEMLGAKPRVVKSLFHGEVSHVSEERAQQVLAFEGAALRARLTQLSQETAALQARLLALPEERCQKNSDALPSGGLAPSSDYHCVPLPPSTVSVSTSCLCGKASCAGDSDECVSLAWGYGL